MPKPSAGSEQPGAPAMTPLIVRRGGLLGGRREKSRMKERLSMRPFKRSWGFPQTGKTNDGSCAFGNLNVGVSFVLHRRSGVVMPTTKFGPEVKAGKNASYWERYLRHLVSTLLIFDKRRNIAAYLNKPNLPWLQLYAYICAKTGCLHSAKLPGATALKALIDGHDNPDTANAGISKIIKRYKADEGTELTCHQLCNVATSTNPTRTTMDGTTSSRCPTTHPTWYKHTACCSYQRTDQYDQGWRQMQAMLGTHLDVIV